MKHTYEDDDNETIVNMNVDGMPWYDSRSEALRQAQNENAPQDGQTHSMFGQNSSEQFTKEEVRAYRFAALKASLIVVAIFAIVFGAFIAFCDFVLFKN
ncbi:MAG: preprotein translocase subunit SecE [Coriobacteriales bacterium]|nr:preprotein translocase subunit SecE [Coriobacteriales bacterium]